MLRSLVGSEMCIRDSVDTVRGLYLDLKKLYESPIARSEKLRRKGILINTLPSRMKSADLIHPSAYIAASSPRYWNNARLIQFKAYNDLKPLFMEVYESMGRDLPAMLDALSELSSEADFLKWVLD